MEKDDPIALYNIGIYYRDGVWGYPQDYTKAIELWHRAGELGHAEAYTNIGYAYQYSEDKQDMKKAIHYYKLAAMGGEVIARHNLGVLSVRSGNTDGGVIHYMMAAGCGYSKSLKRVKELYSDGHATKDDYKDALLAYQSYLGIVKSKQRDEAAAFSEEYRCY